jgi:hypothetical protein
MKKGTVQSQIDRTIDSDQLKKTSPIKINYGLLAPDEQKKWINFSPAKNAGDVTRIRPNFSDSSHLVCHYNPEDGLYDLCYPISNGS